MLHVNRLVRLSAMCLVMVVICGAAMAGDWPQFMGPDRNGKATTDAKLARTWPADGPKVLWTVPTLGEGFGGPAIEGGKVYLLDRVVGEKDVLRCLDLATGKEEWSYGYDAPGLSQKDFKGSRSTPAVDDKYVFIVGPHGQFHCIDKATHQPRWSMNLIDDFGGGRPNWAVAQSPLLYKDMVIVAPLGKDVGLLALDKATGKVRWQSQSKFGTLSRGYVSPRVATIAGVDQILIMSNAGKQTITGAVDASNGNVLWTFDGWGTNIPIPMPEPVSDDRLFLTADYGAGCAMIKITKTGDTFEATKLFANKNCDSHTANAIFYDGYLYANSSKTNHGLVCLNLDGETMWETGREKSFDLGGNFVMVNGLIYIVNGAKGTLHLVEANPKAYTELASAPMLTGRKLWAPLAFADGKLLVRDHTELKCLDVTAE